MCLDMSQLIRFLEKLSEDKRALACCLSAGLKRIKCQARGPVHGRHPQFVGTEEGTNDKNVEESPEHVGFAWGGVEDAVDAPPSWAFGINLG